MDMEMNDQLETKAGIPHDAVVTHGELMRAFEAFKETNDERLALGERRGGDVLIEEKLARINASLDQHQRFIDEATLKAARPMLGRDGERAPSFAQREHKAAFDAYVRAGESSGPARARSQGAVGRQQSGRRLPGAGRDSSTRSAAGSPPSRRSARSPACARSAATSTRSRS